MSCRHADFVLTDIAEESAQFVDSGARRKHCSSSQFMLVLFPVMAVISLDVYRLLKLNRVAKSDASL